MVSSCNFIAMTSIINTNWGLKNANGQASYKEKKPQESMGKWMQITVTCCPGRFANEVLQIEKYSEKCILHLLELAMESYRNWDGCDRAILKKRIGSIKLTFEVI